MLSNLHVKNLAIIDELDVSFGDGLNILTGETGAGKSVIIGSISLALGAKAPGASLRAGCDFALVELIFKVDEKTARKLAELGFEPEDGQMIISRKIDQKKSISRINGETVTLTSVREVAGVLLDIHGQHEHQSLLNNKNHLEILDKYAGDAAFSAREEIKALLCEAKGLKKELDEAQKQAERRELDFLEYEINEIDELAVAEGEEEELAAKLKKMYNSRKIWEALNKAAIATGSDEGAGMMLGEAVKELSYITGIDGETDAYYDQLLELEDAVREFSRSVMDYADSCTYDEEDLMATEKRLDAIREVMSKHGGSYESMMEYYEAACEKADKLRNFEDYKAGLTKRIELLDKKLTEQCGQLSQLRQSCAKELKTKITEALVDLNFLQVNFDIAFDVLNDYSEKGIDEVTFMISTNPGEPLRDLSEVASGGELSRIMLAIKSVMADADEIPSLIFDEIDSGISGRTAQKVSEKMAQIAASHQVFAITHLPQIAAMAETHFLIEKSTDGEHTATVIRELDEEESVTELARMLGGAQITESVIANAREMKKLAGLVR